MATLAQSAVICPACEAAGEFRVFDVREMQFGTREKFAYRECVRCGTLHIAAAPQDLSRFYPSDYYAFTPPPSRASDAPWFRRMWSHWLVTSPDPLAKYVAQRFAFRRYAFYHWTRLCRTRLDSSILDVGCGSGTLLRRMQRYGFANLTGIDPYTPVEIDEGGFKILRTELSSVKGKYGLIMMNHVLEHLADPAQALILARERLEPSGSILVRIPVAGSFAHREYGVNWFNLDAPRHLVIPTLQGLQYLAKRAQLRLLHSSFDSLDASLTLSENYRNDIPGPKFPPADPAVTLQNCRLTDRLNANGDADFGVFVFKAED